MEHFNATGEDIKSLYLIISCYVLINQSHLVDFKGLKIYIYIYILLKTFL